MVYPDHTLDHGLQIGEVERSMYKKLDLGSADGDAADCELDIELIHDDTGAAADAGTDAIVEVEHLPPTTTTTKGPKSILLVVRSEISAAASDPGVTLSARCQDGGDVLHTFVNNDGAPRPHGEYDIPVKVILSTTSLSAGDDDASLPPAPRPPSSQSSSPPVTAFEGTEDFVQITKADGDELTAVRMTPSGPIELQVGFIPGVEELWSRNKGILETDLLAKKTVAVIGLGSGGGVVAVELAKAGVGRFILVDNERLELCNVARHVCDIRDVGRLKTNAMRDQVKSRNPYATVISTPMDVVAQRAELKKLLVDEDVDLLMMATDTATSRGILNELALELGIVAIFGRAIVRAAGGDVLRVRPNYAPVADAAAPRQHPCLNCVFGTQGINLGEAEVSSVEQARAELPAYVGEHDIAVAVTPGLAADIAPISQFMVKLALLELSRPGPGLPPSSASGLQSLDDDFKDTDFWSYANRREDIYAGCALLGADQNMIPPPPVGKEGAAGTGAEGKKDMMAFGQLCQGISAEGSGLKLISARTDFRSGQLVLTVIHPASEVAHDLILRRNPTTTGLDATLCRSRGPRYPAAIKSEPFDVPGIIEQTRVLMDPTNPANAKCGKRPFDQTICRWYGATTKVGCAICCAHTQMPT